jgi:methenyltetrahydrofolate cyclohydrolase
MGLSEKHYRTVPRKTTLGEFLENAAAGQPVPGGGGVAALSGALAASMVEMALNFTIGKKKFAAVDARAREITAEVAVCRQRLLELVTADGDAYDAVAAAMRMPKDSQAEQQARRKALDAALVRAIEPPLEMTRVMERVAAVLGEVAKIGNPNLAGDVGVAATILPAAAKAAALNVWANFSALDSDAAGRIDAEVTGLVASIEGSCGEVYREIECRIRPSQGPDLTLA